MRKSRLSQAKQVRLIEYFVAGTTARCAADLESIQDTSSVTLLPIIERKVIPDSIVYSDSWRGYNVLDIAGFKHYRINHAKLFADKQNHINGIENFWNQAKPHLRKFNGVPKANFGLFSKECEWRFNNPTSQTQLMQLKQWVKQFMG